HLLIGEATPFVEPFEGFEGKWSFADWVSYTQGKSVRGHYARYYGLFGEREVETRRGLVETLLSAAARDGGTSGMVTPQLGSAQLKSGQRTFLHDLGIVAELDTVAAQRARQSTPDVIWSTDEPLTQFPDHVLRVKWTVMPANHPSALRIA